MMLVSVLPHLIAMAFSLIAIILLSGVVSKIGGVVGRVISLLVAGIFFSVTVHAGFELAGQSGLLSERQLMPIMSSLITLGSALFIASAILAIRKFR